MIQGSFPGGRPRIPQAASSPPRPTPAAAPPALQPAARPSPIQPAVRPGIPSVRPQPISPGAARPGAVQPFAPPRAAAPPPIVPAAPPAAVQPSGGKAFELPPGFQLRPSALGQRLPEAVQKKMESVFNTSFADVRVHVGHEAATIGALAFTIGSDLYFAPGQYSPQTMQGQQLLGHELTHVVQQRAGRVRNPLGAGIAVVQDTALEAEAQRMGMRATSASPQIQAKPASLGSVAASSGPVMPAAVAPNGAVLPSAWPARSAAQPKPAPIIPTNPTVQPRGKGPDAFSPARRPPAVPRHGSRRVVQCYFVLGPDSIYPVDPRTNPAFVDPYAFAFGFDYIHPDYPPTLPLSVRYPYAVVRDDQVQSQTPKPGVTGGYKFLAEQSLVSPAWIRPAPTGFSLRVSDDYQMAIEDSDLVNREPKVFYATQQVVVASNLALNQARSSFRLDPDKKITITIFTGMTQITLVRVTPLFKPDLANDFGSANKAPQNCDEIAGRVVGMGASLRGLSSFRVTKLSRIYSDAETVKKTNDKDDTVSANAEDDIARAYAEGDRSRLMGEKANDYADPNVGEAYMIHTVGRTVDKKVFDYKSGKWLTPSSHFHFGGVVARSGNDRITIENYARGDNRVADADPRWYFQMYGMKEGQTYHSHWSNKSEYANPMTLVVGRYPFTGWRE